MNAECGNKFLIYFFFLRHLGSDRAYYVHDNNQSLELSDCTDCNYFLASIRPTSAPFTWTAQPFYFFALIRPTSAPLDSSAISISILGFSSISTKSKSTRPREIDENITSNFNLDPLLLFHLDMDTVAVINKNKVFCFFHGWCNIDCETFKSPFS